MKADYVTAVGAAVLFVVAGSWLAGMQQSENCRQSGVVLPPSCQQQHPAGYIDAGVHYAPVSCDEGVTFTARPHDTHC